MDKLGITKITVESYENKYVFEMSDESDIDDMVDQMKKMLYCIGFQNKTIEGVFGAKI